MVVICTSEKDITTSEVIKHLRLNEVSFFRINIETD